MSRLVLEITDLVILPYPTPPRNVFMEPPISWGAGDVNPDEMAEKKRDLDPIGLVPGTGDGQKIANRTRFVPYISQKIRLLG